MYSFVRIMIQIVSEVTEPCEREAIISQLLMSGKSLSVYIQRGLNGHFTAAPVEHCGVIMLL